LGGVGGSGVGGIDEAMEESEDAGAIGRIEGEVGIA